MMATITFKGVSAGDLGMFVEQMPDAVRAKRRVESEEALGRDGKLHIDGKTYDAIQLKVVLNANGASKTTIHEWLQGSGELVLSDDPDKYYKAIVYGEVKSARRRTSSGRIYDQVTVTFECNPYRYVRTSQALTLYEPFTLANPGISADPIITVKGTGNVVLTVGDVSVTLTNMSGSVTIDCDAKLAYVTGPSTPVAITLNDEQWPVLGKGGTRIAWSGNVSQVTVQPNWRWL